MVSGLLQATSGGYVSLAEELAKTIVATGSTLLLVGEPGVGKVRLAEETVMHFERQIGEPLAIFRLAHPTRKPTRVPQMFFAEFPELKQHGESLELIAENLSELIIKRSFQRTPVFIAPSIHRCSHPSEQLLGLLTRDKTIHMIATAHCLTGAADRLARSAQTTIVPVSPLNFEEAHNFLCEVLGVEKIEHDTLESWFSLTGGNAYALSALAVASSSAGVLRMSHSVAWLPPGEEVFPYEFQHYLAAECTQQERETIEIVSVAKGISTPSLLRALDEDSVDALFAKGILVSKRNDVGSYALEIAHPLLAAAAQKSISATRILKLQEIVFSKLSQEIDSGLGYFDTNQLLKVVDLGIRCGAKLPILWLQQALETFTQNGNLVSALDVCLALVKHPDADVSLQAEKIILAYKCARKVGDKNTLKTVALLVEDLLKNPTLKERERLNLKLIQAEELWRGGAPKKQVLEEYARLLNPKQGLEDGLYDEVITGKALALFGMGYLQQSRELLLNNPQTAKELKGLVTAVSMFMQGKFQQGIHTLERQLRVSRMSNIQGLSAIDILEFFKFFGYWAAGDAGRSTAYESGQNVTKFSGFAELINIMHDTSAGLWADSFRSGEMLTAKLDKGDSHGVRTFADAIFALSLAALGEDEAASYMLEMSLTASRGIAESLKGFRKLVQLQTEHWLDRGKAQPLAQKIIGWSKAKEFPYIELRAIHVLACVQNSITSNNFDRAQEIASQCDSGICDAILAHLKVIFENEDRNFGACDSALPEVRILALYGVWLPAGRIPFLTTREEEVARFASIGYSSKQISQKLHISVRTVDTHLGHIFLKLGISNRDDLHEWFVKRNSL